MPQISVIIPVYKVEKYLSRCIDSVLNQTFSDFEIILVDDGSPDNCGMICDEYAKKDNRIHVIHQQNGGVSVARNKGIDWVLANSDSQWITFVDSDDWVHPDMLFALHNAVMDNGVKISMCGHIDTYGEEPERVQSEYKVSLCAPNVSQISLVWGKLYHRECWETIRFPVGKRCEDEFVAYRVLFQQDQIATVQAPLYYYFFNTSGFMRSAWTPRRMDAVEVRREQADFFKKNGFTEAYRAIVPEYVATIMEHRKYVQESGLTTEEKQKYERHLLSSLRKALWDYKDVLLKQERWAYSEAFPGMFGMLRKIKRIFVPRKKA